MTTTAAPRSRAINNCRRHATNTAAVGALGAIDGVFDSFRNNAQPPLHEDVALQVAAELFVLGALAFAEAFNFDQISEQDSSVALI